MNVYEAEITKYDRRLKRIRGNPDPSKLRCNELLYDVEREFRINQLTAWRSGKPFASGFPLEPLLSAMGFQCIDVGMIGDRASPEQIDQYFESIRADGYPDTACDRVVVSLPMAKMGDCPPVSLAIVINSVCDNIMSMYNVWARHFNVPVFCLDMPFLGNNESLDYVTEQLRELIIFAEKNVPGVKFDEEKLIQFQEADRKAYGFFMDIHNLKKRKPCPISPRDSFREERFPSFYCDLDIAEKSLRYLEAFRDELYERADREISIIPEEKLRVMWTVTGPIHTEAPFTLMQKKGVGLPIYVHGSTARNGMGKYGFYGDETEYGKKLSSLEEQARMILQTTRTWCGIAGGWESDCIDLCVDLEIDAIVNFMQSGCPQTLGLAKMLEDAVRDRLGIPVLNVEGRGLDASSYNPREFEAKLEDFLDMSIAQKERKVKVEPSAIR